MLMRFDPFRDVDRLTEQLWGTDRAPSMPMDAYRRGEEFIVELDMPGVDPSSIDLTIEKNVLTIAAERRRRIDGNNDEVQFVATERPQGTFRRQLFLGEALDTDRVRANYDAGVLTVRVPVAEHAKPRRVEVDAGGTSEAITATSS